MKNKNEIIIGSRGSRLAICQADWVKSRIEERYTGFSVVIREIKTTGDKILDVPLAMVGGKGLFVKEIEEALLCGRIDLAVHSMKDVPTGLPEGLHLAAVTRREDARDIMVSRGGYLLCDLPSSSTLGTSSLRRQAQVMSLRPDIDIVPLRGNLDTRLKKVKDGKIDATVLAAAGMKRLGMADRITEYLDPVKFVPAIGQGALGIETREDDSFVNETVAFLEHTRTSVAVHAERAFLGKLEGGCQVPIAAYGVVDEGDRIELAGLVADTDGSRNLRSSISGDGEDAVQLGVRLAERLLDMGAGELLEKIYSTTSKLT